MIQMTAEIFEMTRQRQNANNKKGEEVKLFHSLQIVVSILYLVSTRKWQVLAST